MKKAILFGSFLAVFLSSCSGDSGEGGGTDTLAVDTTDYSEMNEMKLSDYGLNMQIMLPNVASSTGASIEPSVEHFDGDYLWMSGLEPVPPGDRGFRKREEQGGRRKEKTGRP